MVEIDESKKLVLRLPAGVFGFALDRTHPTRKRRCRPDLAGAAIVAAASLCLAKIVPDSTLNGHGLFVFATLGLAAIGLAPIGPSSAFVRVTVIFGRSLASMSHQITIGMVRYLIERKSELNVPLVEFHSLHHERPMCVGWD